MSTLLATPGLRLLAVVHFLLHAQFWFPIWVTFLQDRQFSMAEIVIADSWFRGLIVLLEFPLGVLGDRLGRKRTFLLGAIFGVATYSVMLFISNLFLLLLCWSLWSVTLALQSGTDAAYRYDLLVEAKLELHATDVFGLFNALASIAMIVSYLIAGFLYTIDSRLPILVNALFSTLAVLLIFRLREPRTQAESGRAESSVRSICQTTWHVCRNSPIVLSSILILSVLGTYQWTTTLLFQPLLNQQGVPVAYYGVVYALFSLLGVVGGVIAGPLSRKLGERTLVIVGFVLLVGSVSWTAWVPGVFCLVGLAVMRFSEQLAEPVVKVSLNREISSSVRASVLSFASLIASFLMMITRPAIGMLAEFTSPQGAFAIWAFLGFGTLILVYQSILKLPLKRDEDGDSLAPKNVIP